MIGFEFHEIMEGTLWCRGERFDRPFRFELDVVGDRVLDMVSSAQTRASGHVRIDGIADDRGATGALTLSPIRDRRLHYELDFCGTDGAQLRFDGFKTIRWSRARTTWTTLRGAVYDAAGDSIGDAVLRFRLRRDGLAFLRGYRIRRPRLKVAT